MTKKLLLTATIAVAALAPAAPAAAAECTTYGVGANTVSHCSEQRWEYRVHWYECSIDKNFDGQADARCNPLFEIWI